MNRNARSKSGSRWLLGCAIFLLGGMPLNAAAQLVLSTTGTFQNPSGPPGMMVSGVTTSSFAWGDGTAFGSPPSSLDFSGASFVSAAVGSPFSVGTITYYNGTIAQGTEANSVDLALNLIKENIPSGLLSTPTYILTLVNSPNLGVDPNADADFILFPTVLPTQTFNIDGVNYTLSLDVGVVSGSGFSSQHSFHVLEGQSATATLMGTITTPVPEPETYAMMLAGLGLLALAARRRKRKESAVA